MRYKMISNDVNNRTFGMYPYVWWDNAFPNEELDNVVNYFTDTCDENLMSGKTFSSGDEKHDEIRRSKIAFVNKDDKNSWIFERLNNVVVDINESFFGFDLYGYDAIQYTMYNGEDQGMYDWHMDVSLGPADLMNIRAHMRKLTFVMLLSEPGNDFAGGEFEINSGMGSNGRPMRAEIAKGRIVAFPSFLLHRVAPVLSGTRRSLVWWVEGPKFR
jgi:PKHD-type hydroxylase